jgi:hypothetical protein
MYDYGCYERSQQFLLVHDMLDCFDSGDHNMYRNETFFVNERTKLTKMHDDLEMCNNTRASGLRLFKLLECKLKLL